MTTSWAHLTRGEVRQAAAANAGGMLLGLSAIFAAPWLLLSAGAGRWLLMRPTEAGICVYALVFVAVVMMDWWIRAGGLL
jgi:hypothetical protein